ncbi:MAG: DNA polymerase I [Verrucomicrobia bacterium]|nr:MAG: DNA polymerase I [Verrucomicrobiota bacterium]TAE89261.1 MAG: DNA polymerase I [Verrucomicrobiota bacterium]TAF27865.1 MAG: DNA polymerase I [Verrucomicrobiota bacterium]TAF42714.1 MAG: DNA polymerase I [Verrucomicrobiota bacterium]
MPRLFLLDGMALVYRAHFALIQNPIRNSKGVNTSALYGFINTLLTILDKEKPTHLGVAWDTSAPTPRHVKYPAYKAQRDEMPEELAAAIPHVKRLCKAFHLPLLEIDGYEADDLIGTLAKRAEAEGFETYMVTPDKDFAQLVSDRTFMWRPGRKGDEHEVIGIDKLPEIWGVKNPHEIIDLLGLMGDSVDNIPGIPGIGPKTAQKLIAEYHSIENLLAHTDQLKGKQKENVETYADQALLSKDLATIIIDAPVDVSWEDLIVSPRDDQAIKDLFAEFEFRSLTKRLFGNDTSSTQTRSESGEPTVPLIANLKTIRDIPHRYHLADSPEKQTALFAQLSQQASFCFDIETTGLDRFQAKLLGIAFSWQAHEAWYLPISDLSSAIPHLHSVLNSSAEKIGHNLKYDVSILHHHGIQVTGPFFDTMLAHALVHPDQRHTMDYLSETMLGYSPIKLADIASSSPATPAASDDLFAFAEVKKASKQLDITAIPLATLAEYAAEDADVTWQLAEKIRPLLDAQQHVFQDIECPLLPVLVRMEMEGIAIDPAALVEIGGQLQQRIHELATSIATHAGRSFNLNSPKQLGEILFTELGLADKAKKTKTGQFKTDEQTLATFAGKHPIIDEILEYREATKLKSTYLDALPGHIVPETGRIHTQFHQLVAATGRLASTDPNLQNIPVRSTLGKQIRKAFVPRPGFTLLSCDYSQIELRVMAALAKDASMIEAFRENRDIHTATAAKVWGVAESEVTREQRSGAKMVNFGIIYGISAFGLSQRLAIPRTEAADIIESYFKQYPAIKEFMDRIIQEARESGYVETLAGRRRYFPDLASGNPTIRGNAERAAINTPIQGSAADMIKLAMIRIDALLRERSARTRMLLQVHDELVFDLAPEEEAELVPAILTAMQTALPLPGEVPILVEHGTGPNWLAAH